MLGFPGDEKNQPYAGANGGVSDIEGGKINDAAAALLEVKINEINHVTDANAVEEIAGNATEDEAESDLATQHVGIEMMSGEVQRDQG